MRHRGRSSGVLCSGGAPLGIAAHPDARRKSTSPTGTPIRSRRRYGDVSRSLAEIPVGQSPSGLAVTPDGRLLLSADRDSDAVSIIDIAIDERGLHRSRSANGRSASRSMLTGCEAYTANVKSDDVTVIDIAARKAVGKVPTGRRPYAVALARGRGFVTDQYGGTITVFDLATLAAAQGDRRLRPPGRHPSRCARRRTSMSPAGAMISCFA